MINIKNLLQLMKKSGIDFFTGVPDSLLKELSIHLNKKNKNNHIVAVNRTAEHRDWILFISKKIPCIYMQNSGLSNDNPVPMADKGIFNSFSFINWLERITRFKDEPQHEAKGKITEELLKL